MFYVATHPEVDKKLHAEIKKVLGDKDVDANSVEELV